MIHKVAILALVLGSATAAFPTPLSQARAIRDRVFSTAVRINAKTPISPNDSTDSNPRPVSLLQSDGKRPQTSGQPKIVNVHVASKVQASNNANGPLQACDAIMELMTLLAATNCTNMFQAETAEEFAVLAASSCADCDFAGAQAIIDGWDASCADDDFGGSGINDIYPIVAATCVEEPAGTYCGIPIGAVVMGGLGEDYVAADVEAACAASCPDLFFETWVDAGLDDPECVPDILGLNLICIQDGGEYCATELENIFGDSEMTDTALESVCSSSCGQTFLDEFNVAYMENEECYEEETFNIAQVFCHQHEDGGYCYVDIEAYEIDDPQCPFEMLPSEWDTCSAECAAEMQDISDALGCCANVMPTVIYSSAEEGETAIAWVNDGCADVEFSGACQSSFTPASITGNSAVSSRGPPNALIILISIFTSIAIFVVA